MIAFSQIYLQYQSPTERIQILSSERTEIEFLRVLKKSIE